MEKLLLRPREVVELTGICKSRIYTLLAAGVIPSVRIGASLRVPAARLHQWLAELEGVDAGAADRTILESTAPAPHEPTRRSPRSQSTEMA